MANLSDIARLAGVSLATVSRVVTHARVAPEKRERILKAMRETGFQPVESAKAFYKQPSSLIGYVIPSLHNLFLNEIGTALEEAAQEKGYQVVVCDSGREPKREWDYIRLLSEMNADGLVITANNDEMEEEIRRCRLPVVVVDRKAGREYEASVSSDNYLGGPARGGAFGGLRLQKAGSPAGSSALQQRADAFSGVHGCVPKMESGAPLFGLRL